MGESDFQQRMAANPSRATKNKAKAYTYFKNQAQEISSQDLRLMYASTFSKTMILDRILTYRENIVKVNNFSHPREISS